MKSRRTKLAGLFLATMVIWLSGTAVAQAGNLTIALDAVPDADTRFLFQVSGPTSFGGILLQDNGNPADGISNQHTVAVQAGTYSLKLRDRDDGDWIQRSAVCSDGSPVGAVVIDATENVTCTFTYETSSTITVLVDSRPNNSQFFNYTFNAPGQSPVNFSLTDGFNFSLASRRFIVAPGTGYSVSQAVAPGWDLTSMTCDDGSSPTNIDVGANENIICTFVNDRLGTINLTLDAQPEAPQQFSFTAGGGLSPSSFTLSEQTAHSEDSFREFENVSPGTYSLVQAQASGWEPPIATCSGGENPASISLSYNETVNCTFTNRLEGGGHLTLKLDAVPDAEAHFFFRVNGPTPYGAIVLQDDGDLNDGAFNGPQHTVDVVQGTYNVSLKKTDAGLWALRPATCSDGSPVTAVVISSNENVTCTFVYDRGGRISAQENTFCFDSPATFDYTLAAPAASPTAFTLACNSSGNAASRVFTVPAGSGYSLTPGSPPNTWELTSASCNDGSPLSDISVSVDESIVCGFTHQQWGRIQVLLDAQPDSSQQFSYTGGGGLTPASFTLSDPFPGNSLTRFINLDRVPPGSGYSVSQAVPAGWSLTSATCNDGSPITNISVSLGEFVQCRFTNQPQT